MKKIYIPLMMVLLFASLSYGLQKDWTQDYTLSGKRSTTATGDIIFGVYDYSVVNIGSDFMGNEPLVANVHPASSDQEIITYGTCSIFVGNTTFSPKAYIYDECNLNHTISGITLYDWDSDGDYELFVTSYLGSNGYVNVYDMNSTGNVSLDFSDTLTHSTQGKHPNCYASNCYVQDINSNIYKYTAPSGTKVSTNLGTLSGYTEETYITIDECNTNNTGFEIVVYGDFDGDGQGDDIKVVKISDMSVLKSSSSASSGLDIKKPINCGLINGDVYLVFTSHDRYNTGGGFTCFCHNSDRLTMVDENFLTIGGLSSTNTYEETGHYCAGDCCPDDVSQCEAGSRATNTWTSSIFTDDGQRVCTSNRNFIECRNESFVVTETSGSVSTELTKNNQGLGYFDVDNDGNRDLVTPNGRVFNYQYNGNLTTIGYLYDTAPEKSIGFISFQRPTGYSSYIGTKYTFPYVSTDYYYLFSSNSTSIVDNPPSIISLSVNPDPAEINQTTQFFASISDDGLSSQIYSGFDCENDNVLEYSIQQRGSNPIYNCTYSTSGIKTGKLYATDPTHLNISNTTQTQSVVVSTSVTSSNCDGFVAPTCTGTCYFYDDFNYANYSIECNGWSGMTKSPTNNELNLKSLNISDQLFINKVTDPISKYDYATFEFQFNFIQNDSSRTYFAIYDKDINDVVAYLYWDTGLLYSLDTTSPFTTLIGNYTQGVEYNIKGVVNFNTKEITYTFGGQDTSVELHNLDVTNAGYFVFDWLYSSQVDWVIDDFSVIKGIVSTETPDSEIIGSTEDRVTYLTTGHFCGYDWDTGDFVTQDCTDRGYDPNKIQFCALRSCISDTGSFVFVSATSNLFLSIIVALLLILIAPLVIQASRMK